MPRAALKDLANARGLASAATEAKAEFSRSHVSRTDEIDEDGVELWADWRCSCVRLRGAPAVVRRAVSYSRAERMKVVAFWIVKLTMYTCRNQFSFFVSTPLKLGLDEGLGRTVCNVCAASSCLKGLIQ